MIKVNLARMSSAAAHVHVEQAVSAPGPAQPLHPLVKVLLIFIIPIGLYIWQDMIVSEKMARLQDSDAQLADIKTQVEKLGAVTSVVRSLSKEKDRLQEQLRVIGKISSKRAFKLRTINEMQGVLPDDCWLENVKIEKEKVFFKGYSRTPSSVQELVDSLEKLDFLASAYNQELKRANLGTAKVHEFNIIAEVKR